MDVAQFTPQECFQNHTEEQIVSVPVPQIEEDGVDVVQFIPQERVNRTHELFVGVPVPQITEDAVDVVRAIPRISSLWTCASCGGLWTCTSILFDP